MPELRGSARANTPLKAVSPSAWLTLPEFSLDDLASAAASERFFPPNIIRAITSQRVFNIDFPLSVLGSDMPLEEKESFMRDLVLFREQSCRTAFFEGRVYILNR